MNAIITAADVELGQRAVGHALQAVALGTSLAITWAGIGSVSGVLMALATWAALSIIACVLHFVCMRYVSEDAFGSVGSALGSVTGRIAGMFSRSAP